MFTVTGTGIVCKEPDLQYTATNNYPICHAVVVNTEKHNEIETPHFTQLILFGERAERFAKEISKGCLINITVGILKHPRSERNGIKRTQTEVTVVEWELIQRFPQKSDVPQKPQKKTTKK